MLGNNGSSQEEPISLYLGHALMRAPLAFRQQMADLKNRLAISGFRVLEFFDLKVGTASEAIRHDLRQVEDCDLLVAIGDEPSLGLGVELMHRAKLGKPALILVQKQYPLSRLIEGLRVYFRKSRFGVTRCWRKCRIRSKNSANRRIWN